MTRSILSTIGLVITKDVLVTLEAILGLIFLDVTLGIFMALSKKEFDPRNLANFLETSTFSYQRFRSSQFLLRLLILQVQLRSDRRNKS